MPNNIMISPGRKPKRETSEKLVKRGFGFRLESDFDRKDAVIVLRTPGQACCGDRRGADTTRQRTPVSFTFSFHN